MSEIGSKYLFQCKKNYLDNIRPSSKDRFDKLGYQILVEIAKDYFQKGEIEKFSSFFQESQYTVNLWTAHLILEYGNSSEIIKQEAIEIIERYSTTPLNVSLANEEKEWLIKEGY
ncbi:hypothetical protein [Flavobacterium sp. IMCC34518]|uniref:hypothetical protein n=1 Tax=Flavobacterium sp. IMCC34518 TaxID=3003623 RepID=UPI0022AC4A04|nr:hypothetical protein [Flavobacterium sp. IMCC34518]